MFGYLVTFIQKHYLGLTAMILLLITTLSLWPAAQLPDVPGTDKTHHFIAYASLILPAALVQHKKLWLIFLGFACYSGLIELIQPYVNRYGEWLDLAANCGGLLTGIFIGLIMAKLTVLFAAKHVKPLL